MSLDEHLGEHKESQFLDWVGERIVSAPGSNVASKVLPFQSWRPFKEAFAPEVVRRAISETPGTVSHLLDPFGGSGTSALTSQFLGVKPTTIEVNPFLADIIESKLQHYSLESLTREYSLVLAGLQETKRGAPAQLLGLPPSFIEPGKKGRFIFSREIATRIAKLLQLIDEHCNRANSRLFKILIGTISLEVSNVVISGKGRRYRNNWQTRISHPDVVDNLFKEKALAAIADISRYGRRTEDSYHLLRGDSRALLSEVEEQDVAVFSPPYPNSFDYTDVYNVELWLLGYLTSASSNQNLRRNTLRSHVQIKREYETDPTASECLKQTYQMLSADRDKLWSKDIPEMVVAYFSDMQLVLTQISKSLRSKGRIYCVVGDSQYAGIQVPVARILKELDTTCGLKFLYTELYRSMRTSPQQGGRKELAESLLVFEKV